MLAPVKVNPIDHAFNAVLAQAVVVMANWPNALAGRLAARVREPPTAQLAGQVSLPRAPGERDLGDRVVDAAQVVDHFFFTFAVTADDTTPRLTSRRRPGRVRGVPRLLPMQLRIGDRFTGARGEWRVIGRPFSASGGKNVFARAELVKQPSVIEIHLWGAHERIKVKRQEEGKG